MAKRKLSILQSAYKDYFLDMLNKYGVDSPAKLDYEQKREFFTNIKEGWKVKKVTLAKEKIKKRPLSKKEQYPKVKVSRPSIPIEPKNVTNQLPVLLNKDVTKKIKSEVNPDQTDDIKINFHPNQFFEQDELYTYPVVKMPKEGAYLKLPRKGRALGKGYKEMGFYNAIVARIPDIEVAIDLHMTIPFFNRPYEPDLVLIDKNLNLYVDIEIDEPYDGYYRCPTHEVEKDDTRDLFFTESGWVVIRFTERQVHTQEAECIAYIKDVLNSIYTYRLDVSSNCVFESQWDYQQAVRWQKDNYREKYLGIEKFGKQKSTSEIVVELDEIEGIESVLDRTIKHKTNYNQDNIAFEDETHKYHHPKDATGNAEYISVTTLIDKFFSFDMDRFIKVKAKKEGVSEEEVLDEFLKNRDEAAEKGTIMHENIENFLKGKKYDNSSKEFKLFKKFYDQIVVSKGFVFVEAEKRVLLDKYNVAGTIDALFKKPDKEEYVIVDWKRSKKLVVDGHPKKYGYGYALSELNHLDNSSYYKYALQQNIYKYILEKNYGLSISSMNLIILHENYDNYYRVDLSPLQKEVEIILNSINHKI
jgi:hypothetical protein